MKRTPLVVMTLVLACLMTSAYQNEEDGFRGLKWGAPVPEGWKMTDFQPVYGGVSRYERPGEDLTLGAAKLKRVSYNFWQGRMFAVYVEFEGPSNFSGVMESCSKRFGAPDKPDKSQQTFCWFGSVTTVLLQFSDVAGSGSLFVVSEAIQKEQETWEKEQAKKGPTVGL
jgi:hypothetical protein